MTKSNSKRKRLFTLACLTLVVVAVGAWTVASGCGARKPRAIDGGPPPNVLIVVMDTTRGDRCSVNGYEFRTTPSLEALGRDGAVFRNCWSPAPWTGPSHASLFTGLRPPHHGFMTDLNMHLNDVNVTLAELLSGAGYATGCFTANDYIAPGFGTTQGFETIVPMWQRKDITGHRSPVTHDLAATWAEGQAAIGRPWFLFINDLEPHNPHEPPLAQARQFQGDATHDEMVDASEFGFPDTLAYSVGDLQVTEREWQVISRLYDAEIAYLDFEIGILLDRLRAQGLLDNTVVIVTADHGENLGDHGLSEHVFSVHRSLLHVPLVIHYPKAFAPGTVIDDVVRLEDVFPTVLELCGLDAPTDIDGASLRSDLPGRLARGAYGTPLFVLAQSRRRFPSKDVTRYENSQRSLFDGRYHLIRRSNGVEELYDVIADPLEQNDLSAAPPIDLGPLREQLDP